MAKSVKQQKRGLYCNMRIHAALALGILGPMRYMSIEVLEGDVYWGGSKESWIKYD